MTDTPTPASDEGLVERANKESLLLLDELLDGPSLGAFYGIGETLRYKLDTVRLTLRRGTK